MSEHTCMAPNATTDALRCVACQEEGRGFMEKYREQVNALRRCCAEARADERAKVAAYVRSRTIEADDFSAEMALAAVASDIEHGEYVPDDGQVSAVLEPETSLPGGVRGMCPVCEEPPCDGTGRHDLGPCCSCCPVRADLRSNPFGPGPDPATCVHKWEQHMWERANEYCPLCRTTRDKA